MYQKLARYASIGMATVGLGLGVAAASSATIDTTGPDSNNTVTVHDTNRADIDNHNSVGICAREELQRPPTFETVIFTPVQPLSECGNSQHASTGDANVDDNTSGGDATSGDASNENSTDTSVSISNGGLDLRDFFGVSDWTAEISNTGPDSNNTVTLTNRNTLDVDNHNDVDVRNNNDQHAYSGDADVTHNTTGGDATTGSATNTNSTSTEVTVSN